MSTLVVIPARLGSTRLPQKPLRLLGGRPLVVRVWERVMALNVADAVVIATDAQEIARVAREAGANVVLTRPEHPSGTDRVAEVAQDRAYSHHDVIVNVQGDEPFIDAAAIVGARNLVANGGFLVGTAAQPTTVAALSDPTVVKVVCDRLGRALYFSRAPIPFLRNAAHAGLLAGLVQQHVGVYAYTRDALRRWVSLPPHPLELVEQLEQLRALADGMPIGVAGIAASAGGGVDTEADLVAANARWHLDHTPTPAGAS